MANTPPQVSVNSYFHNLAFNQWAQIASWLDYTDADGNPVVSWRFEDLTAGAVTAYFWTPTNAHEPDNTTFTVAAADLSNVWVRGGTNADVGSSDTLAVQAFDGTSWSDWTAITLTTTAANRAPQVSVAHHGLVVNQWSQIATWLDYDDLDSDPFVSWRFEDLTAGATTAYFWTPTNAHEPDNTAFTVAAADLSNVWVRGGTNADVGSSDTLEVQAFDGTTWGNWTTFTLTTTAANTPPVLTGFAAAPSNTNSWRYAEDLIAAYSDADGDAATEYEFTDNSTAANSSYLWTKTGGVQPANRPLVVSAADLDSVLVHYSSSIESTDAITVRAFDGTSWSNAATVLVGSLDANAPTTSVSAIGVAANSWKKLSLESYATDADGQSIVSITVDISSAAGAAGSAYLWTPTTGRIAAGASVTIAAADFDNVWIHGATTVGTQNNLFSYSASDGTEEGPSRSLNVTSNDTPPVVNTPNQQLIANSWKRVQDFFVATDPDGDAITLYALVEQTSALNSAYFWTPSNPHIAAGQVLDLSPSDFANLWIHTGADGTSDTFVAQVSDGVAASAQTSFTVTSTQYAPTVVNGSHQLNEREWLQLGAVLQTTDLNGLPITEYQFEDNTAGANSAHLWTPGNPNEPAGQSFLVAASDVANVWVQGGTAAGTDSMTVSVYDGVKWSAPYNFTITTNATDTPPQFPLPGGIGTVSFNSWTRLFGYTSNAVDAESAVTEYEVIDNNSSPDSAYLWLPNNPHLTAGQTYDVSPADYENNLWFHGGTANTTDTFSVRASDGTLWSNWTSATISSLNHAPTVTANNTSLRFDQWQQIDNLFNASDSDGDTISQYQVETTTAGAYLWTPTNSHVATNQVVAVSAADLADVWVKGDAAASTTTVQVSAFDGYAWSNWTSFNISSVTNHAPSVGANSTVASAYQWLQMKDLVTYSDYEGDAATQYQFQQLGGNDGPDPLGAHLWTPANPNAGSSALLTVAATDLSSVWLQGASTPQVDDFQVRASDGISWGSWTHFNLTTI